MYYDDKKFTALERNFLKAFEEFDIEALLEFLLKKGVDPNVNCFNSYFSWVKSSALYELQDEGSYNSDELCSRMENALVEAGAKFS